MLQDSNKDKEKGSNYSSKRQPQNEVIKGYTKYGAEIYASNQQNYLKKTVEFSKKLERATKQSVSDYTEGVISYIINGKYIELALDGTIVSFESR